MKRICLLLVGLMAVVSASAVNPFLEFAPVVAGGHTCRFNVQGGVITPVHRNFDLGAGVGITEQWNFSHGPLIPIFARVNVHGTISGLKPFLSLDAGYAINTDDTDHGAVVVNPMVGLKFGRWYGGIGYEALCWTGKHSGTSNCFNMKIGYNF